MTFTKIQHIALLISVFALSACGGGTDPATKRFSVALESVQIAGPNNEPVAVAIDGVSQTRELEAP